MQVIDQSLIVEMVREEAEVLVKMIGPTTIKSRMEEFGLTEDQSQIAHKIYIALSDCIGEDDE